MRTSVLVTLFVLSTSSVYAQQPAASSGPEKGTQVFIYPILVQAPLYGASINVPSFPGGGGGSEGGKGTTEWSLNAAYMGGIEVQSRLFAEVSGLWTKPSATHDSTPRLSVDSEIWAMTLKGGYRIYKGLGITAGARVISLDLDATIEFPQSGVTLSGNSTHRIWNPIVGADWRGNLSRKWIMTLSGDFGGDSDGDSHQRLRGRVDWLPIPHLAIRLGYQALRLSIDRTSTLGGVQRKFGAVQNTYGPEFGLGIVF
jgi:hypothetical protein